jgi:uncharacterized protein (TIGR03067 family)
MLKLFVCTAVLLVLVPAAWGDGPKEGGAEQKAMNGTWLATSAELGGKPFPEQLTKSIRLVVADGKYTVTVGGPPDEGTVRLDPAKKPKAMDIVGAKGPNQGKTFLCIYERTGDTLRVCYDLTGKARPEEFKTKPDTQLFLVTYKRQKP